VILQRRRRNGEPEVPGLSENERFFRTVASMGASVSNPGSSSRIVAVEDAPERQLARFASFFENVDIFFAERVRVDGVVFVDSCERRRARPCRQAAATMTSLPFRLSRCRRTSEVSMVVDQISLVWDGARGRSKANSLPSLS